jgi:serine/threonine-protein kinase SRPK3
MGFTYDPSGFMNVEDRECYCKDGFHPTLIGDSLDDGRYCIVHKLGFGGFATVWLARDSCRNEYVAIKILAASETRKTTELSIIKYLQGIKSNHTGKSHIAQMLSYFELLGPNGQHLCLVFDVLGPSIGSLRGDAELENHMKIKPDVTRDIAKQCQEGLSYLHECDLICIGK